MEFSEGLVSRMPVIVRRRVKFGECDPAGVVYTPNVVEFALSAFQWLILSLLGEPMFGGLKRLGYFSAVRALSIEFQNMLEVEQIFEMKCLVVDIRNRTFDVEVTGRSAIGGSSKLFTARITAIMLPQNERRSTPIPDLLRRKLERYREETEPSSKSNQEGSFGS